MERQQQQQQ